MSTTWTDTDRQRLNDVALDIANRYAAGHDPYEDDVEKFIELQAKRDAHLAETAK